MIRADTAQLTANVTADHFIEISGPTVNRGLYKVMEVVSETEIVAAHPRAEGFPAELAHKTGSPFTAINQYIFTPGGLNGWRAPGIGTNNPNLMPFDMVRFETPRRTTAFFRCNRSMDRRSCRTKSRFMRSRPGGAGRGRSARSAFHPCTRAVFCEPADSGAAVVNEASEVVGLLAGQTSDSTRRLKRVWLRRAHQRCLAASWHQHPHREQSRRRPGGRSR